MAKRPSFQFYPSDWLRDTALRSCSIEARGLWIDMLCYMHEGYPYGYLKVGTKVILPVNLASMTGLTLEVAERLLHELRNADVFSVDDEGCMFSRRMVRDEAIRSKRAAGGHLGGNPALKKVKKKVNHKDNLIDNLTPEDEEEDIINIKRLNITFDEFWNLYDKKVGDKGKLEKKWASLTDDERSKAIWHIPQYKSAQPDKQFRKDPGTYLNNKSFNDEIIKNGTTTPRGGNPFNSRNGGLQIAIEGLKSSLAEHAAGRAANNEFEI